eukprot:77581-Pleurochrysis_carterae.AAC.4
MSVEARRPPRRPRDERAMTAPPCAVLDDDSRWPRIGSEHRRCCDGTRSCYACAPSIGATRCAVDDASNIHCLWVKGLQDGSKHQTSHMRKHAP